MVWVTMGLWGEPAEGRRGDLGLGMVVAGWLTGWRGDGTLVGYGSGRNSRFLGLCRLFLSCGLVPPRCFWPCVFRDVEKGGSEKGWFSSP